MARRPPLPSPVTSENASKFETSAKASRLFSALNFPPGATTHNLRPSRAQNKPLPLPLEAKNGWTLLETRVSGRFRTRTLAPSTTAICSPLGENAGCAPRATAPITRNDLRQFAASTDIPLELPLSLKTWLTMGKSAR